MSVLEFDKDLQSIQFARRIIFDAKNAQSVFAKFSQDKIDKIVAHIARKFADNAVELAQLAAEETGFGRWQDKVIKNIFASEFIIERICDIKTVGIIREDKANKIIDIGVPLGVITALVPSTNPTSTICYKALIALKAGNAIVFSPHPGAIKCSLKAINIIKLAAEEAGAPKGIIGGLEILSLPGTQELMKHKDVSLILATGGESMVRAAYMSGKPTISGGPGNGPAFIEKTANIPQAVKDIITSKTFDNGVICASEQSIIVERCSYNAVKEELLKNKAYFMNDEESALLANTLLKSNGMVNPETVGKPAHVLAARAGFQIPESTTVLISIQTTIGHNNPYSREKLCPVLGMYIEDGWQEACNRIHGLLSNEGTGHTLVIHTNNDEVVKIFALDKPVYRFLVNTPAALGGIGATTNLTPALTLGCGAAGHGSSSDNVGPLNLINIRRVGYGVRSLNDLTSTNSTPKSSFIEQGNVTNSSLLSLNQSGSASIFNDKRYQSAISADDHYTLNSKNLAQDSFSTELNLNVPSSTVTRNNLNSSEISDEQIISAIRKIAKGS